MLLCGLLSNILFSKIYFFVNMFTSLGVKPIENPIRIRKSHFINVRIWPDESTRNYTYDLKKTYRNKVFLVPDDPSIDCFDVLGCVILDTPLFL